jgi:hypothetical protein
VDFVAGNLKQIAKIGVWKEKSVEPSMCSHLGGQQYGYTIISSYNKFVNYTTFIITYLTGKNVKLLGT